MCNSTAFLCLNLSQEQCTTVALTTGVIDLVTSIISTSLLLCLLLVFKRKAWNRPVKRLTLMFATCFGLLEFVDASVELYNNILQRMWVEVFFLLTYYTVFAILSYSTVILAILLFQIGVAIVPGEWKHKLKSRLPLLEVAIHILIPILSLSFSAGVLVVHKRDDNCSPQITVINIILYVILALLILGLLVIIFLLLYFHTKYSTTRGITRRAKWLLLEFSVLLALVLTELTLLLSIYWIHKYYTAVIVVELAIFVKLVTLLAVVVVVYLPDTHYHKYCNVSRQLLIRDHFLSTLLYPAHQPCISVGPCQCS